jgi:hypothetical protein
MYSLFNTRAFTVVSVYISVVDPYSFFPDPDPGFDVGDQYGSGSKSGPNTDPGLKWPKIEKKITTENFFFFFDQKLQFPYP